MATITTETLATTIDIAPSSEDYSVENLDGELQPLMMAQAVPNPPNDKKRVKVYELKNNDWFDRGTGFCVASFIFVCLVFPLYATCMRFCNDADLCCCGYCALLEGLC